MGKSSFEDLLVWQESMRLTDIIYGLVKKLPKEEMFALSDQMRRAAVSIPSNIAEGKSRNGDKEFKQFLYIARGSTAELYTQLKICVRQNYLTEDEIAEATEMCQSVGKMINGLINSL